MLTFGPNHATDPAQHAKGFLGLIGMPKRAGITFLNDLSTQYLFDPAPDLAGSSAFISGQTVGVPA